MITSRTLFSRRILLIVDLLISVLGINLAYQLRFNFHIQNETLPALYFAMPFLLGIRLTTFLFFKPYNVIIPYVSIEDAVRIFYTVSVGSIAVGLFNFVYKYWKGAYLIPFGILAIDFIIVLMLMTGFRVAARVLYNEWVQYKKDKLNVIIYGAGDPGVITKRALESDTKKNYNVVAFIDHRLSLAKQKLEGVTIYNSKEDLDSLLEKNEIDLVIIALSEISPQRKQQVVDACLSHNIKVLHTPPMSKLINGELTLNQLKEVKIEELLEREPIQLDSDLIKEQITGKRVLVTGAAGSIGSEIARQVINFYPAQLILLDQAESPLYELDLELKKDFSFQNFEVVIADVRNEERMENVFRSFKPQIVFHAAAYKHVPMMEDNPSESILTNVLGTKICADLAVKYNVEKFVFVSTDKAVNPTNVMGASKRIAEIYVQALNIFTEKKSSSHTRFVTTRFGNVLGSNGSVIPLFRKQIAEGGPLTVTHPEVTRFFMTIPEACQLVLEAGAIGNGGEIYIFDMGSAVKIIDLANKMIQLSGMIPGKDIEIKFSGLRPGEKLYEELLANHENTVPTHHPKIMIAKVRVYEFDVIKKEINELIQLFESQDNEIIVSKMKTIVPEYVSNNSVFEVLDKKS